MAEKKPSFLDQIPAPMRAGLLLAVLIIGGYLVYTRVFSPRLAEKNTLDAQVTNLQQQLAQLESQVRGHRPVSGAERAEWSRTQAQLEEKIPADYKLPELIEQIALLAQKANLQDAVISTNEKKNLDRPAETEAPARGPTPGPVVTSAAQARAQEGAQPAARRAVHITDIISAGYFPITITFHGEFRNQAQFMEDLARIPQLAKIETLEIDRQYPETSFRIVLRAYYGGKV